MVRHRFLVPCIAGSNPAIPAIPAIEGGERLLAAFFVAPRSGVPEYGTLLGIKTIIYKEKGYAN